MERIIVSVTVTKMAAKSVKNLLSSKPEALQLEPEQQSLAPGSSPYCGLGVLHVWSLSVLVTAMLSVGSPGWVFK